MILSAYLQQGTNTDLFNISCSTILHESTKHTFATIHALLVTIACLFNTVFFHVCSATLHPNIKDTHHIVCKTSCDLAAFFVPAHFKDSTISTVCFYDLGVFHRPYIQASIQWPSSQVLTVWAKRDRVNRIPGFKIDETPMSTNRNPVK